MQALGKIAEFFLPTGLFFSENSPKKKKKNLFCLPTIPSEFDLDLLSRKSDL